MSLDEVEKVLSRITYKPGSRIYASRGKVVRDDGLPEIGIMLSVEIGYYRGYGFINLDSIHTERDVLRMVHDLINNTEYMEMQASLLLDGYEYPII